MPRKITSGRVGAQVLGSIVTANNSFQSVEADANIILEPNGTGVVETTSNVLVGGNNELRLQDADTNYVALKAPSALSANYTLVFPTDDGNNGQTLRTDGSGNLSWNTPTLSVANRTSADNATYYIAMVDSNSMPGSGQATAGFEDTLSVADSSRLEFIPNPGKLTVNQIAVLSTTASSTTTTGALTVGGGVGVAGQVTATTIVETSSITLKENITPIENALDKVVQLIGVTYDRKDNKEHEAGLIAEWVDKIIPDLVSKDNDGNATGIKYSKLTAYLIEAVKVLKMEIDDLKRQK